MTSNTLDVFSLRDAVVNDYRQFATSFTTIHARDIREQVEAIYAGGAYWPDPLIQISPRYQSTVDVQSLVDSGQLHPATAEIFRADGVPLSLYKHQQQAIALASQGESYVVTTGTGSGKSLSFFIPMVDAVLREREKSAHRRTRAIIIYPMNALANSQLEELDKFVSNVQGWRPVTFARYTGQESAEQRQKIADSPPDILLTNFMMLELLMTRQDKIDRTVISNCAGLRFLVLDELHTYRGRQGADVALLVRRLRERLAPENLQCIGTSATMASEGSDDDKTRVVAAVASRLFATTIADSNVIVETLQRTTDAAETDVSVKARLGEAIDAGIPKNARDADLRKHALAIWVETRLGVTWSDFDQRWLRARPLTLDEASRALAVDSGRGEEDCATALRALLLESSRPECERTGDAADSSKSFFAFKLHQFISGAGHAFSTLEPAGTRTVTVEGQKFLPSQPEKRLYPVHFCRDCGHEYHPVRFVTDEERVFLPRDIDDAPPPKKDDDAGEADAEDGSEPEQLGFLTLHPAADPEFRFRNSEEDYPENWLEFDAAGNPRLKRTYRGARVREVSVTPDGKSGAGAKAWFLPGRFRFCLRCGATQSTAARDRNRLASLSAEGRSSATTILVGSALRWMHGDDSGLSIYTRKLLGFTDNRQDAALQSGHFNDFLFVSLIRAGFLAALDSAGAQGLRSDELGNAQQKALGFDRPAAELRAEWLIESDLMGFNLQEAESTLRQVLSYRVWFDQRRGWRFTNPNLEQLGLLAVEYLALQDLAADESLFAHAPDVVRLATPATRAAVYREIFDHLRKGMAIRSQVLEQTAIEQMLQRSHSRLRSPWGFEVDERPHPARWLLIDPPSRKEMSLRDEDLIVRGGSRSALGKLLKSSKTPDGRVLWSDPGPVRSLKAKEFDALMKALLAAAVKYGLVSEEVTPFGQTGYRLNDAVIVFKRGMPGATSRRHENEFFQAFYANLAATLQTDIHPLFGFEAREHTAQVDGEKRAIREKRFRFGDKERQELAEQEKRLREVGEASRFLPVLFCSPTMELGVDISALNAVYLRNVPPTPANYAQRSGRAGRSGQAALVLTYSSSQSPHDQYFFRDPKAMVHGEVRPPLLDLANRELVESHLHAVWVACTNYPLDPSISELLMLSEPDRPLRSEIREAMGLPEVAAEAVIRVRRVLDLLADDLNSEDAPWYPGRDAFAQTVVDAAEQTFEKAFGRWRDLFAAAERQRDAGRRTMDDYSAPQKERRAAQGRHAQAMDQINLLQKGTSAVSSDFYTYRYLATEGFLPGYNFPRLPLMAYIPATSDGRGRQTFLQRPRFLALAEFGPHSLVYHEGRAYRVVRAMLPLSQRDANGADIRLPTIAIRICMNCGAAHRNDDASTCAACRQPLADAEIVTSTYRIENVSTRPAERITANDEERQRQGFEIQTTFEWAVRDGMLDVREAAASDESGGIAHLSYGAGATITRLNKGLRRRRNRNVYGFMIDPVSGFWGKGEDEDVAPEDPTASPRQLIVPAVQDRKNALLFRPADDELEEGTIATIQHALLRGVESVFQLEEGEVLAEPMPVRDDRTGFLLYEATEGGAGVLTRLVTEQAQLAEVAREALNILHFDLGDGLPASADALVDKTGTACVAACYRCVMSYYNQPDHELLDRRDPAARLVLLRLARAEVAAVGRSARADVPADAAVDTDITAWLVAAESVGVTPPDQEPLSIEGTRIPLVWRSHYVAAMLDDDPSTTAKLDDKGFKVVILGRDAAAWPDRSRDVAKLLGRHA
jgi:hypothetical protein